MTTNSNGSWVPKIVADWLSRSNWAKPSLLGSSQIDKSDGWFASAWGLTIKSKTEFAEAI